MSEFESDQIETADDTPNDIDRAVMEPTPASAWDSPPPSWKREVADPHWRNLPADLREHAYTRDKEQGDRISQMGSQLSEAQKAAQRLQAFDGVFDRYKDHIPSELQREQAIESLLAGHAKLENPETRADALRQLLEGYGVDPLSILPQQLQEQFHGMTRQVEESKRSEVQKVVDDFTKDKTYYAEIRDDVIQEIVDLRKKAPGLDHATVFRMAHDNVVERSGLKARLDSERESEQLSKRMKEDSERETKRKTEEAARVKAARRAASINVRSSTVGDGPKSWDDSLRDIARKHYG